MKINLVDDTALIETSSFKNVLKKERTILGVRHNNASNSNVDEEMMKTQQPMRNVSTKKRSSLVHVCGNVKMNQENGNVGCTERLKFQEDGNPGCHVDACGNKKLILGCSLKKQESFQETRNCCGNEKGLLGFDKNQEKNVKTIQVWVARGAKLQDKSPTTFKEVQSGNGSGKKIVETMISYSRKQMEDLRFVNMEDQNKKWAAIYCQLGSAVKKEFEGLLDCDHHCHQLHINKNPTPHGILGPMAANGSWNHWYLCAPRNALK